MKGVTLSAIDVEFAEKLMRHFEPVDALEAGILTPMAGTRPVRLFSLEEIERFLVAPDGNAVTPGSTGARINYVDPATLARWIAEKLGDADLAAALTAIVATRQPYGFLVPDMKALLGERLAQCHELLAPISESQD